ncbi:peptide/nickel transport system ATP-binding protein [Mucilaginibacter frigoritolerans]|uniref:Peptide/nickel transport system ATP-binding protein n=1 Tax=Mucilaginibacter frigoritolerans TaxID=652788 RepID=A0A562TXA8_9SPHI|nr:ABC transporter ATP-binding protein [Mucilaginibacter frigoritolerans]TWI98197.1 peptide/nickel transport system ATP-binding protein [Mucilaginibacter frigoritolerans]
MLEVKDLNIRFKTANGLFEAVKSITFTLNKGETIGIVGESGSGKSVTSLGLMRLLNDEQTVINGSVLLNGVCLCTVPELEMQKIRGHQMAMIFQEPMTSLNPVLTCGYQITEAIQLHLGTSKAEAKQRTINLFKEVQLPRPEELFDSYPHQISGGQKQRVMIAMALSCNPEILIADEPTTALDVTVQKTIIELLLKLKAERNMSLIFISHDLGVIGEIADRVLVMYKGEVVEEATVKDLFAKPKHPYTKGLLACRPSPAYHLKKLPVIADFLPSESKSVESIESIRGRFAYKPEEIKERKKTLYAKEPILKINQLNTWFSDDKTLFGLKKNIVKAVNQVSFEVYPGETLGLVGESGCGKTTLGRSILRLIEPTSGSINFENTDLRSLKKNDLRAMRRDIQIIFQDPYSSLNPRLTVGDSLMEPMQVHQFYANDTKRKKRVIELLERVNLLPEHFNRYPHEFSGGQRQRIVIARALALQPKFIICDESVSALDVSVQAQVLNLIRELQREFNLTYIFISHDLAVIKHISDRMMVMNKGEIVEMGDPDDIYYHPKEAYTKKLIASIPRVN